MCQACPADVYGEGLTLIKYTKDKNPAVEELQGLQERSDQSDGDDFDEEDQYAAHLDDDFDEDENAPYDDDYGDKKAYRDDYFDYGEDDQGNYIWDK